MRDLLQLAHAGLVLAVAGASACCLSTITGEDGDRGSGASSSSVSTSGTTGSAPGTGGTSSSGGASSSGGGCVEVGGRCSHGASCCDSSAQCAPSLGEQVCCVPDRVAPASGWPGDCCSQSGLDSSGDCRAVSESSSSGSGGSSSSGTGGGTSTGGTGGLDCPPGETSCFANGEYICTDTKIDPTNCGSCRFTCGTAPYCVNGTCQVSNPGGAGPTCPPGLSSCFANGEYICTNFQADPSNCGQCRWVCGTSPYCVNGTCQTVNSKCSLAFDPAALNFGTVTAGVPVTMSAKLTNIGQDPCSVVGISLSSATDPAFSLASGQAQILDIPVGGNASISVQCDLTASGSPTEHSGSVDYQSNDPQHMAGTIFLLASP